MIWGWAAAAALYAAGAGCVTHGLLQLRRRRLRARRTASGGDRDE
ncbi:hypothetical protein SAMN05421854_110182 [Amycolatopsis rubida]|uniref:Heme exporter protein D n=1 Tax=Amycolatopsis rubida TaxID=112413 RepID=A0A1I5XEF5_9PSEU|nr:hypothetical protein SAMN05421854_110182 [Amycolatopsis rubida]